MSIPKPKILANNPNIFNKNTISFAIIQFIVFIFTIKYISRITDYYIIIALFIVAFQTLLWKFQPIKKITDLFPKIPIPLLRNPIIIDIFLFILLISCSVIAFSLLPVENLNVDRWSVIKSFWDTFYDGKYAYTAQSHLGNPPGPMPVYFFLSLPFYLLDSIDYLALAGIFVFYYTMLRSKIEPHIRTTILLLIISSTPFIWEILTRSNLFLNSALVIVVMQLFLDFRTEYGICKETNLLQRHNRLLKIITFTPKTSKRNKEIYKELMDIHKSFPFLRNSMEYANNRNSIIIIGILLGLTLSMRNIFILPYIIMFFYSAKQYRIQVSELLLIWLIMALTVAISFIPIIFHIQELTFPFIPWNIHFITYFLYMEFDIHFYNEFFSLNPFIIQSTVLIPFYMVSILFLISVFLFEYCESDSDVYFYGGIMLFATIIVHFAYHTLMTDFSTAFWNSRADISYFIFCIPFLYRTLLNSREKPNPILDYILEWRENRSQNKSSDL